MSNELSRTKKFFYSTAATALYQLVIFLSGMIIPKIMLVFYSSEVNGLVTSITQFITYFNLVEAGLSGAAVYALYKPIANKNWGAISSVVVATRKFYIQVGTIFLLLIGGFAVAYPFIVETGVLSPLGIGALVLVLGASSVLEFFTLAKYRVLLTADQKTYILSTASLIQVVLNTIIIYVLAYFEVDIITLRAVALLSVFVRTVILMIYVKRKYSEVDYTAEPNTKALDKRWDAMYLQVLGAIHTGALVVILTVVVKDLLLVSVFSIYNMIIVGLHGVMSIFSTGLSASFGDVIVKKQTAILQDSYQQFELIYLSIMTAIYATAMVMIMPFIKIYTEGITDVNYIVPTVGILIVLNAFFYNLKSPQAMLVIAAGMYKETRWQTTIQGAIMVILGCVLGYFWKIEGILIAAIISNFYRDIDLLCFAPKKITQLPISNSFIRWLRSIICFMIIVGIFSICSIPPHNSYGEWILWACLVFMSSIIVVFLNNFFFERNIFLNSITCVKSVFKK